MKDRQGKFNPFQLQMRSAFATACLARFFSDWKSPGPNVWLRQGSRELF